MSLAQKNPKDLRLKTRLGDILSRLGQKAEAVTVYKSVAGQYAQQGLLVQAISVNKMILEITPDDSGIRQELAALYSKRQGKDDCLKKIKTVIKPVRLKPVMRSKPAPEAPTPSSDSDYDEIEVLLESDDMQDPPVDPLELSDTVDLSNLADVALPPTPLFSDLEAEALERVMARLVRRAFKPGEAVCSEGDRGDSIFIVSDGHLAVSAQDSGGAVIALAQLNAGDFFGEFGYFSDRKRHATVKAMVDCVALELVRKDVDLLARQFPGFSEILQQFYQRRLLQTLMAKSRIFSKLSGKERQGLSERFVLENHSAGKELMKEGDQGDAMYLVQEGQLIVETKKDGQNVELAVLKEGDFCGEFSVLTEAKRTADVICKTPVKLLRLSKDAAQAVLSENSGVKNVLKEIADQRVAKTIQAFQSLHAALHPDGELKRGLV